MKVLGERGEDPLVVLEAVCCQSAERHVAVDFARVAAGTCKMWAGRGWQYMLSTDSAMSDEVWDCPGIS